MSMIARNIRHLRSSRGLSLEAVSKRSGLSKPTIWAIERGESSPKLATVEKLARAFSVPATELIGEDLESKLTA